MTFPLITHIGQYSVLFHTVTDYVSIALGTFLYWRVSKHDGISSDLRTHLFIGAALGVLVGSRLLGALENPYLFMNPPEMLYYYASKTVIGGIAGGILGMEMTKLFAGLRRSTGDSLTIPLMIAIIIGRFGCLFTGVVDGTVGNPCSYWWCFNQGGDVPRHPTSLYEIVFLVILLAIFMYIKKRKKLKEGVFFRAFIICYFLFRFLIEFIKPTHPILLGLSATQLVCILYPLWYAYDIHRIAK